MGKFLTFFLQMTFSILINSKKQQHCNFHLIYIRNRLTWGGLALSNTNYFHPEMHFWGSLSKLAPLPFVSLTDFWFSLRVRGFDYLSSHAIHLDVLASSANAAFEISEYLLLATRTQTRDRRLVCDSSVFPPSRAAALRVRRDGSQRAGGPDLRRQSATDTARSVC